MVSKTSLLYAISHESTSNLFKNIAITGRNNQYHNIGSATVAEIVGDTFNPTYIPKQAPLGPSQYGTSPMHTIHDQSYETGLSPETTHKINELKRLVYKYRQYQNIDPGEIVKWAINGALKGDTLIKSCNSFK